MNYAARQASPPFTVDKNAQDLIVSISSGYPYILHLLGDSAFWEMGNDQQMVREDVALGIETVLKSDKREKYFNNFEKLPRNERIVLVALSQYPPKNIPSEIPYNKLLEKVGDKIEDADAVDTAIDSLVQNGFLTLKKEQTSIMFTEELFRIYITIMLEEQRVARLYKIREERGNKLSKQQEAEILRLINYGEVDIENRRYLSDAQEAAIYSDARLHLLGVGYTTAWEDDDEADMFVDDVILEDDEYDYLGGFDADDDEWLLNYDDLDEWSVNNDDDDDDS